MASRFGVYRGGVWIEAPAKQVTGYIMESSGAVIKETGEVYMEFKR